MKQDNISIVFMGSPDFAVPSLRKLSARYGVTGVITQPDRPSGRGRAISRPAVKIAAEELGIPVLQPLKLREPEALEQLRNWAPDLIVVAAFGQILRKEVLEMPAFGCINVHASFLPRWRGAAPIQACLIHGDAETGATIMKMDAGIDTGPILAQKSTLINNDDTAESLSARLSQLGADLLVETLPGYLAGSILPREQDESLATYAPMLKKEDGELDFNRSAADLERKVRAFSPWPGAFTFWHGQLLKIHQAMVVETTESKNEAVPGNRYIVDGLPAVGTADGLFVLVMVQPAGKKEMHGTAFLAGARDWV